MIIKSLTLLNLFPLKILNFITNIKLNTRTEIRIRYGDIYQIGWIYTIQYRGIFGWRYLMRQMGYDYYNCSGSTHIHGSVNTIKNCFEGPYKFYIDFNLLRLGMEINKESIETVLRLLSEAGVSETGRNSIQIEWENSNRYLEFEIYNDMVTFFSINGEKVEQGGEIISIQQLVKLLLNYNLEK